MYERKIGRVWIQWGFFTRALSLGIHLSTIQCSLDLLLFWFQVEFPPSKRWLRKRAERDV
jgi:hypothetical protein